MPSNIQYLGSCVDSFDPDSGSSNIPVFSDVSDFANKEETFRNEIENGEVHGFIGFDDFTRIVGTYKFLKSYFEFYFYPLESGNIYVLEELNHLPPPEYCCKRFTVAFRDQHS